MSEVFLTGCHRGPGWMALPKRGVGMKYAMIVNDSRLEKMILTDMLKSIGMEVVTSEEQSAVDDVKRLRPDIAFVNYIMQTLRGDSLIGMMKLMDPELICVLTTGSEVTFDQFKHRKVDALLHTPANPAALRTAMEEAEERSRKRREPLVMPKENSG